MSGVQQRTSTKITREIFTFSSNTKTSHSLVSQHNFMHAVADDTSSSFMNFAPIARDSSVRMIVDERVSKWTEKVFHDNLGKHIFNFIANLHIFPRPIVSLSDDRHRHRETHWFDNFYSTTTIATTTMIQIALGWTIKCPFLETWFG